MKKIIFIFYLTFCLLSCFSDIEAAEIKDQAGFVIKTPEKMERLVIVFPQTFGLAYILGLGDKIVGMPLQRIGLEKQSQSKFYQLYSPNLVEAIDVGNPGNPNTETILSLKPDLVFSAIHVPAAQKLNALLREQGIAVLGLKGGFGSVANWQEAVTLAGIASGKSEAANKYINLLNANLKLVKERAAKASSKPKVLVINSGDRQTTIRGSRTTFIYELIQACGATIIEQGDNTTNTDATAEAIFKFDPDIVITDTLDHMKNWDWWKYLRAVKSNKVFVSPIDDNKVVMTGWCNNMYAPLGVLWLAKCIHPELYKDIDMGKEHDKFCLEIFGKIIETSKEPMHLEPAKTDRKR